MKYKKLFILIPTFCVGIFAFSFKDDLFLVSKNLDVFASLYKEININYVENTQPNDLMRTGIDAMLNSLDPYTEYVPESEIENYKLKYISTQYGGLGMGTIQLDGKLYVNEVTENNPAHLATIKAGDEIVQINNINTKGKDRAAISQLLRGPKGSTVVLNIIRDGVQIIKEIKRDEIKQPNVSYTTVLNDGYGYIKLDKFLENSGQEVKDALLTLNKQQIKGLILDLRNNGGGILQEAVKIINLFVQKDVVAVSQIGRNPAKSVIYKTTNVPVSLDLPLVVLINEASASASEIVAGSLQDLDRAVIIGQTSYGKGLVQQTFNLPYNSLVKVTVAKYYTSSGRSIQALDYEHKDNNGVAIKTPDSLKKAFQTKNARTVYSGNGVYPDLYLPKDKLSPIAVALLSNHHFFTFANTYRKQHAIISNPKEFRLAENDYKLFISSLQGKNFSYQTTAERLIDELKKSANEDKLIASINTEIEALATKMQGVKKQDLINHKEELRKLLESQIISRYYYERGRIEQAFQYDLEINKAIELFKEPLLLGRILSGYDKYKTIGTF